MNARELVLACLAAALPACAQLDLSQWNLRTVRTNNWGAVALPTFDSIGVDTRVQDGVARSKITLVWTAGGMRTPHYRWRCHAPEPETTFVSLNSWPEQYTFNRLSHDTLITYPNGLGDSISYTSRVSTCAVDSIQFVEAPMDSLEMTTSFQLPLDAVVSDLSLWVGDTKVPAWIMDRNQASAQYNQIVGIRRDPALLETWGYGSYSLRVFPQKTGETRRLELEVTQAWRPGMELPVRYTHPPTQYASYWTASGYLYDSLGGTLPRRVAVSLSSGDGSPVSLDLGALGTLSADASSARGDWDSPTALQATVRTGGRDVWAATRNGRGAFGSRIVFRDRDFEIAPVPEERIVVLDAIHQVERARRLALIALARYGVDGNRVDLLWRDATGTVKRLWGTPREFTAENAAEAVATLKAWVPADSLDPLELVGRLAKTDSGKVVILLSDVGAPEFAYAPTQSMIDTLPIVDLSDWSLRYNAYWQERSNAWARMGATLHGAGMKLFGWWRDNNASTASQATGGYPFGDIEWGAWTWWRTGDSLVAPRLFGADRRGWTEGIQNATLHTEGLAVDSLADDLNGGYYYPVRWISSPFIVRQTIDFVVLARTASPSTFAARTADIALPESLAVTLAGRNASAGDLDVGVDAFWGGLDLKARRKVHVPVAGSPEGAKVWAGEYVRKIQPWIWTTDSIRTRTLALGRTYRIATPATSFLALEPGVAPYDSLGGQGEDATAQKFSATSVVANDMMVSYRVDELGGVLLDTIDLETILAGRVLAVAPATRLPARGLRLALGNGLSIHAGPSLDAPRVQILDLSGRELASMAMSSSSDGWTAHWRPARTSFVVVRMIQDGQAYTNRVLVRP